jgi:peptidoglycan-associated lipoprotein
MNKREIRRTLALVATCGLLLAGCASAPEDTAQTPAPVSTAPSSSARPGAQAQGVSPKPVPGAALPGTSPAPAGSPQAQMPGTPAKRSVYFDFDRFDIKDEYRPVVEAHAKYLRDNPKARMRIEGHADERGSREYNIALGQRRAESVRKALVLLGGREEQIEPVSFGEEKPVCTQSDESCWWQNRRADMRYTAEL